MEQRSDEWFAARCGRVTASRITDVVARTRNGWGASRANYLAELVAERLTGQPANSYTSPAMQWGTEKEPEARLAFQFYTGLTVEEVGFVDHPRIEMAGASPDGRVVEMGERGNLELKCPNTATHIETLLSGKIADKYIKQMMWQMACDGTSFNYFGSYDPRMPPEHQMFIKRVERDDKLIVSLESDVAEFLVEVDDKIKQLNERLQESKAA